MAGLDPAVHVLTKDKKGVDARDKRGHDELKRPIVILGPSPTCRFV
jgi:hypothetical protein